MPIAGCRKWRNVFWNHFLQRGSCGQRTVLQVSVRTCRPRKENYDKRRSRTPPSAGFTIGDVGDRATERYQSAGSTAGRATDALDRHGGGDGGAPALT